MKADPSEQQRLPAVRIMGEAMFRVDVDAHVDETEATWEYLGEGEARYRPVSIDPGVRSTLASLVRGGPGVRA